MPRVPKPTKLKILEGVRPSRINKNEPEPPPGLGDPPDWFDDFALEAWATLRARMGEMDVATRADESAVALYCNHYSMFRQAGAIIRLEGLVVKDTITLEVTNRTGTRTTTRTTTRVHPMVKVQNEAARLMARLLPQFGMTPAGRSSLHIEADGRPDALMEFLAGRPFSGPPAAPPSVKRADAARKARKGKPEEGPYRKP